MRRALPVTLLIAGCCLTIVGILRGEAGVVLSRAVRICLECIGIG